jgi:hypothetical protein
MGLNEPQQRRLEVTLSLIEQTLFELEACYLAAAVADGKSVRVKNDLTEAEIRQLLDLFGQMRRQIHCLRQQFRLQPHRRDLRRMVAARFSHFWATLHDCRTDKLKGTGPVDPQLKRTLDPRIDELLQLVLAMQRVIQGDEAELRPPEQIKP